VAIGLERRARAAVQLDRRALGIDPVPAVPPFAEKSLEKVPELKALGVRSELDRGRPLAALRALQAEGEVGQLSGELGL
jgi:hypothetical protein